MKYLSISTLLFFLFFSDVCSAQRFTIKGSVFDTLTQSALPHASITLIRSSDSIMETFTRNRDDGHFELHTDSAGKYIMLVRFPGFADYFDIINLKDKRVVDLGVIPLISRSHLLKEFVLTQQVAAIKIKGDTTEYIADSFKVKDNATVEDLLKRLPGLEVDKDGKVTAQGEEVKKILVDGEEFFSDDPAVVTKSFQAKVVDKVQVFDKKSDQAEFTGIDDGQKTKTINLQLKDNVKKGYFGKVDAGGGTDGYFQDQAMANSFKGKRQLSVFGIMSNTGQVGLGWADRDKFTGSDDNTEITDDGMVYTYNSGNEDNSTDWNGSYNGQGIPTVWTGGVHYADKWDADKDHITGNYRYARQNVEMEGNTITQYILPDSQYFTKEHTNQFSTTDRHSISAMYEHKIDSTSSIKITSDAGYKDVQTSTLYNTESLSANNDVINSSNRKITNDIKSNYLNTDLIYRKKFAKKGRSLSVDFKENYKDSKNDGFLNSTNTFADTNYSVDQRKIANTNTLAFASKITYTEPVSKVAYLELNYGLNLNNSSSLNSSYDKPVGSDSYSYLDSLYSSDYSYKITTNKGGANLRFVYKKINFSFGSDVSNTTYNQGDLYRDTSYRYNYFNLFPKAAFQYKVNKQSNLSINYFGYTNQPTIQQIQPLQQNTDPLNIAIGNPNLKEEFHNNINAQFHNFKPLTGQWIWASANFSAVNNAIGQATNTDELGRRTYQYINVNGNYNGGAYLDYGFKISKWDMSISSNLNSQVDHINDYVNGAKNVSNNNLYTFGINFDKYKQDKYQLSLRTGVTYNDNHATISTYATSYWTSNEELSGSVQLPLHFEIGTTLNWFIRQRTVVFDQNNDVLLWKAYVSKKFLKSKQLELKVFVNDILNQNIGFTRFAQNNYITENTYNTISRYGMVSLIWNFSKTGGAPAPAAK
ncbi:MAG TPA: TonB-dependent receptor [Flavipsychrobacter sp.]|nr:TonB-dependent receptor [Flavipsychrobacter sp.]